MNGKLIALISYIPFAGWIAAFVLYLETHTKDSVARFHLRQTLGLQILFLGGTVIMGFFRVYFLLLPFELICFALWILGLLSALKEEEKPVFYVGHYFQDWFKNFIR